MLKKDFGNATSSRSALETDFPSPVQNAPAQNFRQKFLVGPVFLALLGSLALAAIYGRVALFNLTTALVGGDLDGYENLWNNYWVKTALFNLRNPFYTDYIYYPTGTSLRFHTLNPFNGLLTLPFNLTLGWVTTTNLLFLLSLAFTTFFGFLLIRDLTGNSWAAFGGAALFTYANHQVIGFFSFGQAEKLSAEWYPLYLFFMFRALYGKPSNSVTTADTTEISGETKVSFIKELINKPNVLYIALSILTLIILSLTDWQYLIYAVFTTLLYFGFVLFTRRSWREKGLIFVKLAVIGGVYAALVLIPLVLPMLKESAESPWLSVSGQSIYHSVDLLDFVKPGFIGGGEDGGLSNLDNPRPGLGNPGYLAFFVGLFGLWWLWKRRKTGQDWEKALFWLIAAGLASLMALGPRLQINGQVTEIPLPYDWFSKLPVLSAGRDPARFYTVAMLGFGILTAFGLRAIFEHLPNLRLSRPPLQKIAIAGFAGIFIAVSLGGFVAEAGKAPVYPPEWPPFYEQLAQDKDTYAILELPLFTDRGRGEDTYEAYQSLHNKKRFGGRLARDHKLSNPDNFVKKASLYRELLLASDAKPDQRNLFYPDQDFLTRTDYRKQGLALLNYYDVRYIIMYKDAITTSQWGRYRAILAQVLGDNVQPFYEDRLMYVYKVPTAPALPANPLTLDVGNGWFLAQNENGRVYRWADNKDRQLSEFYSINLSKTPIRATFNATIFAHKQPRTVKLLINGYEAGSFQLNSNEPKNISVELTLPSGNNVISFTTDTPPLPTDDPKADARLLSFAAYDVSLTPKQGS